MTSAPKTKTLSDLRKEYTLAGLDETNAGSDPFTLFSIWMDEALAANLSEPTAMTLATASKSGKPSARMVLLKTFDSAGFVFFTNYESRKGKELAENPAAALVFHWVELERQVRVAGAAARVSREESERYFHSRPAGSQIGALASKQSEVISSRSSLESAAQRLEIEYRGKEIPVPPSWGGFRIVPAEIEFWQGRPNRLHDRLRYSIDKNGKWNLERLAP